MKIGPVRLPDPIGRLRSAGFPYRSAPVPRSVAPLPQPKRTGVDFDTDWARRLPARVTREVLRQTALRPVVKVLADPDVRGTDRLTALRDGAEPDLDGEPITPPLIFAANHHSHVDTPLLLTSIPEPWCHKVFVGAAADYFFRSRVAGTAAALTLNAFPIERTKVSRRSADEAALLIDEGWSMVIFPEGGRSPDGWGQPFRGGAAYLAIRCGVPVVPIHLEGTGRILRKGHKLPARSRTSVTFGDALWPEAGEDARRFAARIEAAVAALADETATDWYSARLRAHSGTSPPLGGPELPSWRRAWALGHRGPKRRRRQAVSRAGERAWPDLS